MIRNRFAFVFVFALVSVLGTSQTVLSAPPNTAVLDGRPIEYDDGDLVGTNTQPPHFGAGNVISNLFVTWDADFLYVALQGFEDNNKLAVLMDVDPGNGTGTGTTTNWAGNTAPQIAFNGVGWEAAGVTPFGMDYTIQSEGFFNTILRVLYDGIVEPVLDTNIELVFDSGNGATPQGTPADMVVISDGTATACKLQGFEARIPWSEIYDSSRFGVVGPGGVPTNATIRICANLHNNNSDFYSSSNAIPIQTSANANYQGGALGLLTTDDYIDVLVDQNGDGIPDLGTGDVNAPYIQAVGGGQGRTNITVLLSEPATPGTAGSTANWLVDGVAPDAVTVLNPSSVQLTVPNPLPGEGSVVSLVSSNIQDTTGNFRVTENCLFVGPAGLDLPVDVTFVLDVNSGFGSSASNFYVTGNSLPLAEAVPPPVNVAMANIGGTLHSVLVTFPEGTPDTIGYRYAGVLSASGTNNYESIDFSDYQNARRQLDLPTDGSSLVVTDYLGAAAAPLRQGEDGRDALYVVADRGDAGVRVDTPILFQLDLSLRNLADVTRVLLQGTDPLRGFNQSGVSDTSDFASDVAIGWDVGGIELVDDGTLGDLVASDGIYSREWAFTTDGTDATVVPGTPNSLVGGEESSFPDPGTPPYEGTWQDRRSPRPYIYKYYVVNSAGDGIEFPLQNIAGYVSNDEEGSLIVEPITIWGNDAIPLLSATNPATILEFVISNKVGTVVYSNIALAADNNVEIADTPTDQWRNYGLQGVGSGGLFTAVVANATNDVGVYRVVTPGLESDLVYWEPNPAQTGQPLRVWYNQVGRLHSGKQQVYWFGANPNTNTAPFVVQPMTFAGNGDWFIDLDIGPFEGERVQFLFIDTPTQVGATQYDKNYEDKDYTAPIGPAPVSFDPDPVNPGGSLTITYDPTGTSLGNASAVELLYGFDGFQDVVTPNPSFSTNATLGVWEVTIPIPTQYQHSVDFVITDGAGTYDNNFNLNYTAFIQE